MTIEDLKAYIEKIVAQAKRLKDKYTDQADAPVNYACVFCHNNQEFDEYSSLIQQAGKVIKQTQTGPLVQIEPWTTVAGELQLVKIRRPDPTRPQQGDADFTVKDYQRFKEQYLPLPNFSPIVRDEFEMIELKGPDFDVLAYFSHPTLEELLAIKKED